MDESEDQDRYQGVYPPRGFADVASQVTNSVSYGNQWLDKTFSNNGDIVFSTHKAEANVIDPERKRRWGVRKSKKPVATQPQGLQIRYCGCKFCSNCQPQVSDDHMPCLHLAHSGHEKSRVEPQFCCGPAQSPLPQPPGRISRPFVPGISSQNPSSQSHATSFDPSWNPSTSPLRQPRQWFGDSYDPGSYRLSTITINDRLKSAFTENPSNAPQQAVNANNEPSATSHIQGRGEISPQLDRGPPSLPTQPTSDPHSMTKASEATRAPSNDGGKARFSSYHGGSSKQASSHREQLVTSKASPPEPEISAYGALAENQRKYLGVREIPGEGMFHLYESGVRIPTHVDGEPVNPAWGLTKAYKPRKRLAIACLNCREKKMKCEPGTNSCFQCEKAKRPCRRPESLSFQTGSTPSDGKDATATSDYASTRLTVDETSTSREASQPRDWTSNDGDHTSGMGTEELKAGLSMSLKERLLGQLVERLVHDVVLPEEDRETALLSISSQMPTLVRQFSIILYAVASNNTQRSSATFIRHQRSRIVNDFCSSAASAPDAQDSISLMGKLSLLWSQELELTPFREAREFAFGGDSYLWLLSNMNQLARDHETSKNSAWETRDCLLNALVIPLADATTSSGSPDQYHSEVVLAWAPRTFLAAQCLDPKTPLESLITICGDVDNAQATTCGQYVRERWPGIGHRVLKLLSSDGDRAVLDLDKGARIEAVFEHQRTRLMLHGDLLTSLQAAETAIWMGTALRAAPFDHDAGYCYPSIKGPVAGNRIDISYDITALPSSKRSRSTRADCWLAMFRNPVIAHAYPVLSRPGKQLGLEISLPMLQVLAHTTWLTEFGGLWMLKGFSSLVAPIAQVGSSLLWHLYTKKDGTRIPYTTHEGTQLRGVLDEHSLMLARHFVGWHGNVHILAGTNKAPYRSIDLSASDPATPNWCALAGVTITAGKFVTGGANFVRSQKDSPVYFESSLGPYYSRIDCATHWRVALFDTVDRVAWLVDGATAILHLCRAWMTWKEGSFDSTVTADSLCQQDVSSTPLMADKILLNKHNRRLKIFEQSLEESDTEAEPGTTTPSHARRNTSKWWRFEDLVIERWHILESIHDHLVRRRTSPPKELDFEVWKTTLEGFNFVEVANAKRPIEPRAVHLHDHAGTWPMMCKKSDTISLFADNFGPLIAPSETTKCRWNSAPLHSDFMVAPLNVLRRLCSECRHEWDNAKRKTATGPRCGEQLVEITHGIFWSPVESTFRTCDCKPDTGASDKACSKTLASLREHAHPANVLSHDLAMAKLLEHVSGALVLGESRSRLRAGVADCTKMVQGYAKALCRPPTKGTSDSGIDMGASGSSINNSLSPMSMPNTQSTDRSDPTTEENPASQSMLPQKRSLTYETQAGALPGEQRETPHGERPSKRRFSLSTRMPRRSKFWKEPSAGSNSSQREEELYSSDVVVASSSP